MLIDSLLAASKFLLYVNHVSKCDLMSDHIQLTDVLLCLKNNEIVVFFTEQKILLYLPELVHKRWQFHSLGNLSFNSRLHVK